MYISGAWYRITVKVCHCDSRSCHGIAFPEFDIMQPVYSVFWNCGAKIGNLNKISIMITNDGKATMARSRIMVKCLYHDYMSHGHISRILHCPDNTTIYLPVLCQLMLKSFFCNKLCPFSKINILCLASIALEKS